MECKCGNETVSRSHKVIKERTVFDWCGVWPKGKGPWTLEINECGKCKRVAGASAISSDGAETFKR